MRILMPTLIFFSVVYGGAQQNVIPLWEDIPNRKSSSEKEENAPKNHLFITKVNTPTIEVFMPDKKSANGQAVLICPGGGYHGVSYNFEGTTVAKWLNSLGITAFVLKYRMPNSAAVDVSYEAPLQDAQRAIRMIRFNAEKYGIAKNKIGVMGFSAGGHLASTLGTQFDTSNNFAETTLDRTSARPDFMILIYPVITMKKEFTHGGSRNSLLGKNPTSKLVNQFSNELQVKPNTPPTFIVHCQDDKAVPVENSLLLYAAVKEKDIPVEMHLFPKGGHGFGLAIGNDNLAVWTALLKQWMKNLQ